MTAALPALAAAPHLNWRNGRLFMEGVALDDLAALYGSPLYVYSRAALTSAYQAYQQAIGNRRVIVCFGMKANSNLAVLQTFARLGSGFDIVSMGELARVRAAGGDPSRVVFSGVGKTAREMAEALKAGVMCFNVESMAELERLDQVARSLGTRAPVSLRVNPDVDPKTHPYISTGLKENKFGIPIESARAAYQKAAAMPGIQITGVDYHIGSQITELEPFLDALDKLLDLVAALQADGISLHHLDLGGGLGIRYSDQNPPAASDLLQALFARIDARGQGHHTIVFEPGRSLVGNAGVLLTRVEYVKPTEAKNFVIVDAAMNDLLRPTLYSAWHGVVPVVPRDEPLLHCDVVGPVCESGDWLAKDRQLAVRQGDLLAIESAGAYGMVMASNYNTRPRAAEVMVDGATHHLIRHRETIEDLFAGECLLP